MTEDEAINAGYGCLGLVRWVESYDVIRTTLAFSVGQRLVFSRLPWSPLRGPACTVVQSKQTEDGAVSIVTGLPASVAPGDWIFQGGGPVTKRTSGTLDSPPQDMVDDPYVSVRHSEYEQLQAVKRAWVRVTLPTGIIDESVLDYMRGILLDESARERLWEIAKESPETD